MYNTGKIILIISLLFWADTLFAQQDNLIRINVYDDTVKIYHNNIQPIGHGFNIYRESQKLNQQPVTGIIYPEELPLTVSDNYDRLTDILNTDSPRSTYFKLRTNIYAGRLTSFLFPAVAEALGLVYTDTSAPIGENVNYRIEFVDDRGQPTGEYLEKAVELIPKEIQPPTDLSAKNKGRLVTLSWKYPTSSLEADDQVIQFKVYRKEENQNTLLNEEIIVRNNATSDFKIRFDAIETGTEETYFVTAVDIAGHESLPSEILKYNIVDNVAPQQISGVSAFNQGNSIIVSWNTATESDLSGYIIYRSERMNRGYRRINRELLDPIQTYFADSTIRAGKNFSYKVAAVDQSGNEGPQSLAAMARIQDVQAPEKVSGFTARYKDQNVELSWRLLENQQSFRSYVLLRKRLGSGNNSYARLNRNDLRDSIYIDNGLAGRGFLEGAIYEYVILAMDSVNNFSDSTLITIQIPDLTKPEAPTNLIAINHDGIRVELNWDASTSADVVSHRVYRGLTGQEDKLIIESDLKTRRVRDSNIELGQQYIYTVTAIDSLGNESESSRADTVWIKDSDPPRQVRNVRLNESDIGTLIRWEPVPGFDLAGYRVYRAEIATGRYNLLDQVPIESTEFIDPEAEFGLWYRVRAVDTSGNESKPSEPVQLKGM